MLRANNKGNKFKDVFREDREFPTSEKQSVPVTPKMLVKALKRLKNRTLKGLFFNAKDVTCEILRSFPQVEQDFQVLYFEVSDKLSCAAAAGILGLKQDHSGYYAFNSRQKSNVVDYRSELMFWVFYKRLLSKRVEEYRNIPGQSTKEYRERKNDGMVAKSSRNKFRVDDMRKRMPFTKNHLASLPNFQNRRKLA